MGRDHFPNIPIGAGMGFARGVMLLDDCEGTFTWTVVGTGGDDVHAFATAAAFQGTYGLQLKTRTTAAAEDDYVQITRSMSYPESGLLVFRLRLLSPDISLCKAITIQLGISDGVNNYLASIVLRPSTPAAGYGNVLNAFVAFATAVCPVMDAQWLTLELVFDTLAHNYIEAYVNGYREDLAGVPVYAAGADADRRSYAVVMVDAAGAAAAEIYVDNIYVGEYLES